MDNQYYDEQSTLERKKLQSEIQKLEAETDNIRRSNWARPSTYIPLVIAFGAVANSLAQWHTTSIKERELAVESTIKRFEEEKRIVTIQQKIDAKLNELRDVTKESQQAQKTLDELNILTESIGSYL